MFTISKISRSPRSRDLRARVGAAALALAALGGLATAAAARADHLNMALGGSGQLYSIQAGTYGSLFGSANAQAQTPGAGTTAAATPSANTSVLALDTIVAGSPTVRQLVPSSQDGALNSSPALLYEDASGTLFVVWVSSSSATSSVVKLASYSGGTWSQPIQIISNPYAAKTPPQIALTRDSHQEVAAATGIASTHYRSVLQIVWSEMGAAGLYQAFYAPVIFEDGAWIGTVPEPMLLNTYDAAEQTTQGGPFSTPLVTTPAVQTGRDISTAVAAFASDASGMLTAVELDYLPEELRILADTTQAAMLASGAAYFPNQLSTLASQTLTTLQSNGGFFQSEALQAIGSNVQAQILNGATDLDTLAVRTRAVIIDSGARFSARALKVGPQGPVGTIAPSQIVEIVPPNGGPSQFVQFRVASTRPWPTVALGNNSLQILISPTGDNVMATWLSPDGTSAYYTNTLLTGGWSATQQVQPSSTLSLDQTLQLLQQRVY